MAESLKNAAVEVLTSPTTLYTCPVGTTATVHSLFIGNKDLTDSTVTVEFFDGSNTFTLGANIPVLVGGVLVWDKPINLSANQQVRITADVINRLVAFASIVELT